MGERIGGEAEEKILPHYWGHMCAAKSLGPNGREILLQLNLLI